LGFAARHPSASDERRSLGRTPHRIARGRKLTTAAVLLLVVAVLVTAFTISRGRTPGISGRNSVATLETVRLGGVAQYVLIRGDDRSKPVLLFLHGGPGAPLMYLAHAFQRELERDFVVVQWDRAGAGKSLPGTPPEAMRVSRQIADTVQLTNILRARFGQDRIYLVGHSWGTYLGMLVIAQHPELYRAYVGVGQIADSTLARAAALAFVSAEAERRADADALAQLAADPTMDLENLLFRYGAELHHETSFVPMILTGLQAQEYTLLDAYDVRLGPQFSAKYMQYDVIDGELMTNVTRVEIPVYFFLGRFDYTVPSSVAQTYFDRLQAPSKGVVWFEDSAHFAFWEEPAKFAREMRSVASATR
jgi:pimeloyl-ACP methyl ester carboxylesterase